MMGWVRLAAFLVAAAIVAYWSQPHWTQRVIAFVVLGGVPLIWPFYKTRLAQRSGEEHKQR